MSNQQKLIDAGILKPDDVLTREQSEEIESLTEEELQHLISTKDRTVGEALVELRSRITHRVED